jgi:aspartyl-tRNA(Asn)/glutamyl-tRNA(Gln) amidotransferase subunit A
MTPADYAERIARFNPRLNAFVDLCEDVRGDGLVWGVKSNIAVRGLPCTAGIGAYRDNVAADDAEVVRRIRASGGVVLGAVNMHEGALGATTDNIAYGRTQNPWRAGFTPGGSSGGSGAAVAAGLCDVALGSDTMGSIRIPAAYCGVQGHKPTAGLVPNEGVLPLSPTLDHIGPLARDVRTLWEALHVIAGWRAPATLAPIELPGLRVGVWDGGGSVEMTAAVRRGFDAAIAAFKGAGARLSSVEPPLYDYAKARRAGLLISEVEGAAVHAARLKTHAEGFSEAFRALMAWGVAQPPVKLEAARAHIIEIRDAAASVFRTVDVLVAPTAPQQAFCFDDPTPANQADFTAWANFAGLPATAVFTGFSDDGLPLSLQIVGPKDEDRLTLRCAAALERIFGAPQVPPEFR